ncbi:hypothetical protein LN650_23395 [Klebsiella pneumoniae subsp. pneumoniae]|nr:hypothetical protein [Klebsiella pneumoniae subsp. pneumoniae]
MTARALIGDAQRLVGVRRTHPLEARRRPCAYSSAILRRLRDQGSCHLYISHYLNEIATPLGTAAPALRIPGKWLRPPGPRPAAEYRSADAMMVGRGNRPAVYSAPAPGGAQYGRPAAPRCAS